MTNGERLLIAGPCVGLSFLILCFVSMGIGVRPYLGLSLSFVGAVCIGVLVFNRAHRVLDWLTKGQD